MSEYAVNKLLTTIARQHATRDRLSEDEMAGAALDEVERAALAEGDVTRLYELGANPYLIRRVFRSRFRV